MKQAVFETNVREYFEAATEEQLSAGLAWYQNAHDLAVGLSKKYSVDFDIVCRVIAVISPRLSWENNERDAENIIAGYAYGLPAAMLRLSCLRANAKKAFAILAGDVDQLRGPKVTRFYENIRSAYDSREVTIDTHAYRVCVNDPNWAYKNTVPTKDLEPARNAYVSVADEVGLLPMQVQAVCWLVVKAKRA